jgi:hypothetical protein
MAHTTASVQNREIKGCAVDGIGSADETVIVSRLGGTVQVEEVIVNKNRLPRADVHGADVAIT